MTIYVNIINIFLYLKDILSSYKITWEDRLLFVSGQKYWLTTRIIFCIIYPSFSG